MKECLSMEKFTKCSKERDRKKQIKHLAFVLAVAVLCFGIYFAKSDFFDSLKWSEAQTEKADSPSSDENSKTVEKHSSSENGKEDFGQKEKSKNENQKDKNGDRSSADSKDQGTDSDRSGKRENETEKDKSGQNMSEGSTNNANSSALPSGDLSKELPWNLILVNPQNKIPEGFSVKLVELKNGHAIDERAYPDLQQMMDDARAQGLSPLICSSYRTMEKQTNLYNNLVKKYQSEGLSEANAKIEAAKWVAIPGTSEHQCGLAVDIVATSYQQLNKKQENTAEQQWLMKNSYRYGFILRYPEDKVAVTGIGYEPWHYRYVGKEAAKEIFEQKICLEEYLANSGLV